MNESINDNIGEMNVFKATDYPSLSAEVHQVITDVRHTPVYYKSDIIISFLRDHSMKTEWIEANPVLAKIILSGSLVTKHIESLFDACRWNKPFRTQFERYLKGMLIS